LTFWAVNNIREFTSNPTCPPNELFRLIPLERQLVGDLDGLTHQEKYVALELVNAM
jgi:hypothetical protein